jgi:hypothetical protein
VLGLGKVTNAAVKARETARARRLALDADRQAQDERIDAATAEVILAAEAIAAAGQVRDAAVEAARAVFDAAVAAADQAAAEAVAEGQVRIGRSLRALAAEKVAAARIAELTELSQADVRRLSKVGAPARAAEPVALAG